MAIPTKSGVKEWYPDLDEVNGFKTSHTFSTITFKPNDCITSFLKTWVTLSTAGFNLELEFDNSVSRDVFRIQQCVIKFIVRLGDPREYDVPKPRPLEYSIDLPIKSHVSESNGSFFVHFSGEGPVSHSSSVLSNDGKVNILDVGLKLVFRQTVESNKMEPALFQPTKPPEEPRINISSLSLGKQPKAEETEQKMVLSQPEGKSKLGLDLVNFSNLYNGPFQDVVFVWGSYSSETDPQIGAHRLIVNAGSPKLAKLIDEADYGNYYLIINTCKSGSNTTRNRRVFQVRVVMTDAGIELDVMRTVLKYLYFGSTMELDEDVSPQKVFVAAHKYEIKGLKALYEKECIQLLSYDTAFDLYGMADDHGGTALKKEAERFIKQNKAELMARMSEQEYKKLIRDYPKLMLEIAFEGKEQTKAIFERLLDPSYPD